MFRRKPHPHHTDTERIGDDPLLTAELPERVATGRNRLAYQHDPALREALSERELQAERELAERIREHHRSEQLAELSTAETTAAEVRKTTTEIVRTEARDLALSRRALADQQRESSPHAQLAQLYRIKKWSGRALAGVVAGAMLYSAANVQHNLAPGGPSEPLFWMSYLLEALISTVLVVFMISGSAVARWKVIEGEKAIQWTEVALLAGSILLNTFPYLRSPQDWGAVAVHSVAPIMMGVALFGHQAVAKRMGAAIAKASLEVTAADDTSERLAALLDRARTTMAQPPAVPVAPAHDSEPLADEVVLADFEREFAGAAEPAPARTFAPAPQPSAESADTSRTSPASAPRPAPHHASAGSADGPHSESADSTEASSRHTAGVSEYDSEESADSGAPTDEESPAPVRTSGETTATSDDAATTDRAAAEVPTPRTTPVRAARTPRTSPASAPALSGAGSGSRPALAFATVESADTSAQVRDELTGLAEQVRARRVGQRLPADTVVRVLEMSALPDMSINAIHEATGVHRKTIERILDTATVVRAESAGRTGGGGRVLELRKPTDRA